MPAIDVIYKDLNELFGGTNPNQFFCMTIPATCLNPGDFTYDTKGLKPAFVKEAESSLTNQLFDVCQVTGSSNGRQLASQYLRALAVLVPKLDPNLALIKTALRTFLNSEVRGFAQQDASKGEPTVQEVYSKLYREWVNKKEEWEALQADTKAGLIEAGLSPAAAAERFNEWYGGVAESHMATLDAAMGKLLAVYSPPDMLAIQAVLESGLGAAIEEARRAVENIREPSPSGGFVYPVKMRPSDWFLDLVSDSAPSDLLQSPAYLALKLDARRESIAATLSQISTLLARTKADSIQKARSTLDTAQAEYASARRSLLGQFTQNTVLAAEMWLAHRNREEKTDPTSEEITNVANEVDKAKGGRGDVPSANAAGKLNPTDLKSLISGQRSLSTKQSALIEKGLDLANAGLDLAASQATSFTDLAPLCRRLKALADDVESLSGNIRALVPDSEAQLTAAIVPTSSSLSAFQSLNANPRFDDLVTKAGSDRWIKAFFDTACEPEALKGYLEDTIPQTERTAADPKIGEAVDLARSGELQKAMQLVANVPSCPNLTTAVERLKQNIAETCVKRIDAAMRECKISCTQEDYAKITKAVKAAQTASFDADATAAKVSAAVAQVVDSAVAEYLCGKPTGTAANLFLDVVERSKHFAESSPSRTPSGSPSPPAPTTAKAFEREAKRAKSSDRFMELRFKFDLNTMSEASSLHTSTAQTDWHVDLFFGSASGAKRNASSEFTKASLERGTSVEIAMCVAKVEIERDWFDPGVFSLSRDMERLSSDVISSGPIDLRTLNNAAEDPKPKQSAADIQDANTRQILPCFPVAFLIAKDVTINFKASNSSLGAVKDLCDSRAATGGGFFCFSASQVTASHGESDSIHTKAEGQVITISIRSPQILGWFIQFCPKDESTKLDAAAESATIKNLVQALLPSDVAGKVASK